MRTTLDDPRIPSERERERERARDRDARASLRTAGFAPPRRRWPGVLALCMLVAGAAGLLVSAYYDKRSNGEKLDATVQNLRDSATAAARDGARATDRAAAALGDAGITAAVKTALAADPSLSALKIEVNTNAGVVSLAGPAPDERARERAAVLAAAPAGVVRVDNGLVVAPAMPAAPTPTR